MKAIRGSAEHHFLTILDKLKNNPKGWVCLYFALAKTITHNEIISDSVSMSKKLANARLEGNAFMDRLVEKTSGIEKAYAWLFADNDIVFFTCADSSEEKNLVHKIYGEMAKGLKADFSDAGVLANEFYNYQKFADQKLLSARLYSAYEAMGDKNKVSSIALRRSRRDDTQILLVEDDKFSASYALNLLGKEYDLVISRSGEEGIAAYIEYAPDIVFMDIHLPGLDGNDTLQAIMSIDPEAYVVMTSVDTEQTTIMLSSQGGASNFIKKPFSKDRLVHMVKASPYVSTAGMSNGNGTLVH